MYAQDSHIKFPFITPLPYVVPAVVNDRQEAQIPDRVQLSGMLGARIHANTYNRLLETVDVDRILQKYRKRDTHDGFLPYDGEHIGKFIHAATLAWANSGDEKLRAKVANAVAELIKTQEADGYLGCYMSDEQISAAEKQQGKGSAPKTKFLKRWTEWDTWSHIYNMTGLLTWARFTGDQAALDCCRKMGDLLCKTFSDGPGQLDFTKASTGRIVSSTMLNPMVILYRMTGDPRYRDFCQYIVKKLEMDQPFIESLSSGKGLTGHTYTTLAALNAHLEWYRMTGDKKILTAAQSAWEDITSKRLYLTGTLSYREQFPKDFDLPNNNHTAETCVTVEWLMFNQQLLQLTGNACYAQELERTAYNQLASAQRPDGRAWCYYVGLSGGNKPYMTDFDNQCCLSSGPRGFALLPTVALTTDQDGLVVNLYDQSHAQLKLKDGTSVAVNLSTRFPSEANISLDIHPEKPADFAVKLRIPTWCSNATLKLGNQILPLNVGTDGYVAVRRIWKYGDQLTLELPPNARVIPGDHDNLGRAAICYGPLVLASDTFLDPAGDRIELSSTNINALNLKPEPATGDFHDWTNAAVFRITSKGHSALLAPIGTVGVDTHSYYRVWLSMPGQAGANLAVGGTESFSLGSKPGPFRNPKDGLRESIGGSVTTFQWGSLIDGGLVHTFDNAMKDQDWYEVTLTKPAALGRVVFTHGYSYSNGGWFDTSAGKPQVQVQTEKEGPWTTVGELSDYPATTATDFKKIDSGTRFTCTLAKPLTALAVRVLGKPSCGNNPKQSFSSCDGLAVYEH